MKYSHIVSDKINGQKRRRNNFLGDTIELMDVSKVRANNLVCSNVNVSNLVILI